MKNSFKILCGLILVILFLNSCEEDPFNLFNDDPRDRITGTWVVDEDSEIFKKKDLNRIYTVTITKDAQDSAVVLVKNFYEFGENEEIKMVMDGRNLDIPDQTVDGFRVEVGSGTISLDFETITLYYYVAFTGDRDVVRADYSRPENR